MSSILGGFLGTVYTNATLNTGTATNRGVITRFSPVLEPGNIPVRGTGERGLYDILIGFRQPRFTIEFLPTDKAWIASIQDGSSGTEFLFLKFTGNKGLTFVDAYVNRLSLEATHGEAIRCTAEFWAGGDATYPVGIMDWDDVLPLCTFGARMTTPYRWLDSDLYIKNAAETQWWSWRYETNNNLQRLGNVATGGTRAIEPKQRDVTGLIVKDCEDFEEYGDIADLAAEMTRFCIRIRLDINGAPTSLLDCERCRWGTLEAPSGPEDLIAKRFPFTATDLTTLTP